MDQATLMWLLTFLFGGGSIITSLTIAVRIGRVLQIQDEQGRNIVGVVARVERVEDRVRDHDVRLAVIEREAA